MVSVSQDGAGASTQIFGKDRKITERTFYGVNIKMSRDCCLELCKFRMLNARGGVGGERRKC